MVLFLDLLCGSGICFFGEEMMFDEVGESLESIHGNLNWGFVGYHQWFGSGLFGYCRMIDSQTLVRDHSGRPYCQFEDWNPCWGQEDHQSPNALVVDQLDVKH